MNLFYSKYYGRNSKPLYETIKLLGEILNLYIKEKTI